MDVGAFAVKLATLRVDEKGRPTLESWSIVPVDGALGDTGAQARALETAVARHGGLEGLIVSTLPRQRAVVRCVTLPSVVKSEIDEIMQLEVERNSPIPADEMEMGYQVVAERSGTESDVLMAAAARADLAKHLEVLQQAGIEPDVIDVAGINVGRAYLDERHAGEQIAVIDVGRGQTTFSVWRQGFTRFSRSVPWGAEKLHEFLEGGDHPVSLADLNGDLSALESHPGWELWSRRFVTELRRTFAAYEHDRGGAPVRKVYLSGGLGAISAVVEGLRKQLPCEVETAVPGEAMMSLAPGVEPPPPSLADCIGTALRAALLGEEGINLLPQSVVAARRAAKQRVFWRNCGYLALAAGLLLAGSVYLLWLQRANTLRDINAQLAEITPRVRRVTTQKDKIDTLMSYTDKEHSAFTVLHAIYTALPEGTNIGRFEFTKQDSVLITGDVFTDNDVLRLGEILRGLPHFKEVNQGPIKRKPIAGTGVVAREYEFQCVLVSKPERKSRVVPRRGTGR